MLFEPDRGLGMHRLGKLLSKVAAARRSRALRTGLLLVLLLAGRALRAEPGAAAAEPSGAAPTPGASHITLSADFDNGSLGEWEVVGPDTVRFTLTKASGGLWFHFHIRGVKGRAITFQVPMTRDLTAITAHYYDGRNRPAYSYDRTQWLLAEPGKVDMAAKTFTFQVRFDQDAAWVAYCIPYTNDTLQKLLTEYAQSPYLRVHTLATTAGGRPVHWLTISDKPDKPEEGLHRSVWVVARENGWEAPASWVADGLARLALGQGQLSERFRQRIILQIIPILTPDAVAGGWFLYPSGPQSQVFLSAAYDKDFPEVAGLTTAVRDWVGAGRPVDLALRLQCWGWISTRHEFREELFLPQEQVEFDGIADHLQRAVPEVNWTKGHVFPGPGFVEYCYRNFSIKGATLSVALGARDNGMTQGELQDIGRALGEVLVNLYTSSAMVPSRPVGENP
jgi:hypothetical protein